MKQFKPLGDRVLVKPNEIKEEKSKSGLILSNSTTNSKKVYGEVVEIGTGIFSQSGERIPMTVKVGDSVIYEQSHASNSIEIDGNKYIIFNEHQLIGIVQ
jgi:chaperonin GroES